jgi:tripartite-type tricarboxylate transporter receptor subunit TctC
MRNAVRFAAAVAALVLCTSAWAQTWASKPLRIIVPFPPGGGADLVVRAMAPRLTEKFGQPIVVENRPGAAGNIGAGLIAKAPPDGLTVGVATTATLCINPSLEAKMPFDPAKDLLPVSLLASIPFFLVAHPAVQAATVGEVIALAKASPGKLSYGHAGNGTLLHLSGELLKLMTAVDLLAVPYKGGTPAVTDLIGGQVQLAIAELPAVLSQAKAGKLKILGVTTARRIAAVPDVPTLAESGVPGYDTMGWFGVVAPAKTPADIIGRWNVEIVSVLNVPEIRDRLSAAGAEPAPTSPDAFNALIRSETAKWARVVKAPGIKLN